MGRAGSPPEPVDRQKPGRNTLVAKLDDRLEEQRSVRTILRTAVNGATAELWVTSRFYKLPAALKEDICIYAFFRYNCVHREVSRLVIMDGAKVRESGRFSIEKGLEMTR